MVFRDETDVLIALGSEDQLCADDMVSNFVLDTEEGHLMQSFYTEVPCSRPNESYIPA